jgi:hypothetical protein
MQELTVVLYISMLVLTPRLSEGHGTPFRVAQSRRGMASVKVVHS